MENRIVDVKKKAAISDFFDAIFLQIFQLVVGLQSLSMISCTTSHTAPCYFAQSYGGITVTVLCIIHNSVHATIQATFSSELRPNIVLLISSAQQQQNRQHIKLLNIS